jgi:U3 small nucleolar RNA-associated protein 13
MWTLKTGACTATLADHTDKVWAVDVHQDEEKTSLITGGSDARVIHWVDATKEIEAEAF